MLAKFGKKEILDRNLLEKQRGNSTTQEDQVQNASLGAENNVIILGAECRKIKRRGKKRDLWLLGSTLNKCTS